MVGVLCQALICEPARADVLAFGNTLSTTHPTDYYATLELFNGSTLVATVSTNKFQGYISNSDDSVIPSIGGPNGSNTSYAAGSYGGMLLVDYFGFNLSSLSPTLTITSAELVVKSGQITNDMTYTLFGATQWVTELVTPADQNAALYQNLLSGASNVYGSFQLGGNNSNPLGSAHFRPRRVGAWRHRGSDRQQVNLRARRPGLDRRAGAFDLDHVARWLRWA